MKKITMALFVGAFLTTATLGGATEYGSILNFHHWNGIDGVFIVHEDKSQDLDCGDENTYILLETHSNFKELYALLLLAFANRQAVKLQTSGCSHSRAVVQHVWVQGR